MQIQSLGKEVAMQPSTWTKEVVLTHEIEGSEPWPDEEPLELEIDNPEDSDSDQDIEDSDDGEDNPTIEWDLTKGPDDPDDQPTLF